jgi:molybdopterin molybdotransferase
VEIFTGAELPADCDAVEIVERVTREGDTVIFQAPVASGANVSHQGEILSVGRTVFHPHRRLSSADLAVLAAIGMVKVPVFPRIKVSILTSGDELVPVKERPGRGQIREGNTHYLRSVCERASCKVETVDIVPDNQALLENAFREALEAGDALITTGGVSVGKYDLVGAALAAIGVEPVLHRVAIKPGKPIWFGVLGSRPVFGLPGNPVSSMLGFEVFVRPALARMGGAGESEQAERLRHGRWRGAKFTASDRQHNEPARVAQASDGVDELWPIEWKGSADIVAASQADAFAVIPPGATIEAGAMIDYRPLV